MFFAASYFQMELRNTSSSSGLQAFEMKLGSPTMNNGFEYGIQAPSISNISPGILAITVENPERGSTYSSRLSTINSLLYPKTRFLL
jgi:hypothetical protein